MRISDWSSDVCSSDLLKRAGVSDKAGSFAERRAARDIAAEDLHAAFDRVLVDAPCSGSGAWRRHPDARWRLTPAGLDGYKAAQRDVLRRAAALVKPKSAERRFGKEWVSTCRSRLAT